MNRYELKQELRRQRLEDRAERLAREGDAAIESGMERLRAIPFGQPILVGHHSERRDRNYRRKAVGAVDRGMALKKEAAEAAARAAAVGTGGISSDDPDAVVKLKEQLSELEAKQAKMIEVNKLVRKDDRGTLRAKGYPEALIASWFAGDYLGRKGFPSYELTNNGANIRRIKQRIAHLERNATRETKTEELPGGVRLVENAEINRVQLFFPGKPPAELRAQLKSYGFHWSPTEGAWQRHLTNAAVYWARQLVKQQQQGEDK